MVRQAGEPGAAGLGRTPSFRHHEGETDRAGYYNQTSLPPSTYLGHDVTDVVNALRDGLAAPGDGDGSLSAVGQHLTGHLDTGSRHLADLLDLAPSCNISRVRPQSSSLLPPYLSL